MLPVFVLGIGIQMLFHHYQFRQIVKSHQERIKQINSQLPAQSYSTQILL